MMKIKKFVLAFLILFQILALSLTIDFSNASLGDILNEISLEGNVTIIYPSDITSLKTSINLQNVDVQTALNLLLLPMDLDYEKIDEKTYVIFSKKAKLFPRVFGEYNSKYVNPEYLLDIIESFGIQGYVYGNKIYFYVSSSETAKRILEQIEQLDRKSDQMFFCYNLKKFSLKDILFSIPNNSKSNTETTNTYSILSTVLKEKNFIKETSNIYGTVSIDLLTNTDSSTEQTILSFDDLEIKQLNDSLLIKTSEEEVKIQKEALFQQSLENKNTIILKSGDFVFVLEYFTLNMLGNINKQNKEEYLKTDLSNKETQKSNFFSITYFSSEVTLSIGVDKIESKVAFSNPEFSIKSLSIGARIIDNLKMYISYHFIDNTYTFSLSDIVETNWIYISPTVNYNIQSQKISFDIESGLKLNFNNLFVIPSIIVNNDFYSLALRLGTENINGAVLLSLQKEIGVGIALKW